MKEEYDVRKHAREGDIKVEDIVLVKQKQTNKGMSPFEPFKYIVREVKGNMITAENITGNDQLESRVTTRNISFFKKMERRKNTGGEKHKKTQPNE